MPIKQTVLRLYADDQIKLAEQIAQLHLSGQATQSQVATLIHAVRPRMPCTVHVDMRTPKGTIYVVLDGMGRDVFTITQRAKIVQLYDDLE